MSEAAPPDIIVGVDTHKQTHAAVAITELGARLAALTIPVDTAGYRVLEAWACSPGKVRAFGVEGTGSYGAGLSRFLCEKGLWSMRSPAQTGGYATGRAKRTTSMQRTPLAPCSVGRLPPFRS
jgi:transposase